LLPVGNRRTISPSWPSISKPPLARQYPGREVQQRHSTAVRLQLFVEPLTMARLAPAESTLLCSHGRGIGYPTSQIRCDRYGHVHLEPYSKPLSCCLDRGASHHGRVVWALCASASAGDLSHRPYVETHLEGPGSVLIVLGNALHDVSSPPDPARSRPGSTP
jgi:hypothetical protein